MNVIVNAMHKLLCNGLKINLFKQSNYMSIYSPREEVAEFPRRIFSGIQPTGNLHLGNYLGTIQNWIALQESNAEVILYCIADMHSITLPYNPLRLKECILTVTATLLACGIDTKRAIVFQQSSISMHAELCWILGCFATMARLMRLPQYKEKSTQLKDIPLGLYIYPVLQAADILLYKATQVPVGKDQVQHLQYAQELAYSFNSKFGKTFPIPRALVSDGPDNKIKSLRDPSKKMSKSDVNPKTRIELTDSPAVIINKIKKAVTDCTSAITYDPILRPGIANLIVIHSQLTGKSYEEICKEVQTLDSGKYKLLVADIIIETFQPIQERLSQLLHNQHYLHEVLKDGKERAMELATNCVLDVKDKIGFGVDETAVNVQDRENISVPKI